MPDLGVPELLIILFVVLLFFGGSRLPEIGRGLGKALRELRDAARGPREEADSKHEAPRS